jgi:hypothetical protein
VRVRATVGQPGGSAEARWRQARATEWAAWTRTLPWRIAVILGIGAWGGVLGNLVAPRLGLMVGALAAVVAGWGLRFRSSPDTVAWQRGAAGERRTARLLDPLARHGWGVLHDLAVPGQPGQPRSSGDRPWWGVRDRLQAVPGSPPARLLRAALAWAATPAPALAAVSFEADQAALVLPDPGVVVVVPVVAVHGTQIPWGKVVMKGVPVVAARRLPSMLRQLPAVLGPERVASLADQARARFHAAA